MLLRLYETAGGRIGLGVDSEAAADDLAELAARGLVILGPKGEAALTGEGLRQLFEGLARSARDSSPVDSASFGRDSGSTAPGKIHGELELEEIGSIVGMRTDGLALARNALPPPTRPPPAPPARAEVAPLVVLKQEVDRLVRELLISGGLGQDGFGDKLARAHDLQQAVLALEELVGAAS